MYLVRTSLNLNLVGNSVQEHMKLSGQDLSKSDSGMAVLGHRTKGIFVLHVFRCVIVGNWTVFTLAVYTHFLTRYMMKVYYLAKISVQSNSTFFLPTIPIFFYHICMVRLAYHMITARVQLIGLACLLYWRARGLYFGADVLCFSTLYKVF